jgi:hypothetical protein
MIDIEYRIEKIMEQMRNVVEQSGNVTKLWGRRRCLHLSFIRTCDLAYPLLTRGHCCRSIL